MAVPGRAQRRPPPHSVSHEVVGGIVLLLDFLQILVTGGTAYVIYIVLLVATRDPADRYALVTTLSAILFVLCMRAAGCYRLPRILQFWWQIGHVLTIWSSVIAVFLTTAFLLKIADFYSRGWTVTWALATLGVIGLSRVILHVIAMRWLRQGRLSRVVAIIGTGEECGRVLAKLGTLSEIFIAGVFDDRSGHGAAPVAGRRSSDGNIDDLVALARSSRIDEIVISLPLTEADRIARAIAMLRSLPIDVRLSMEPILEIFPVKGISETGSLKTLDILERPLKHWGGVAKWLEDKCLSSLALVLCSPVMLLAAVAIKLESKGPVLFVQDRFGFNNAAVRILKFRTMHTDREDRSGAARTTRGDPRVTPLGRILRRLSIDELPQLFNVLRGDMSLVGPRPHALAMRAGDQLYHDAVDEYVRRHSVRPGITGWAQVNGLRGEIDTMEKAERRVAYDLYYIDHWTLWLDIKILFMTVRTLLSKNAY